MGDPAGIGPEIIVKAFMDGSLQEECRLLVVGDAEVMERVVDLVRSHLPVRRVKEPAEANFAPSEMDVIHLANVDVASLRPGEVSASNGRAAVEYVEKAAELAQDGSIDAICSAPLNKEAMHLAGYDFPGQTEMLAHLTGTKEYGMAMVLDSLHVFLVTNHVSLRKACEMITKEAVLATIRLAQKTLRNFGLEAPRIAVSALNPHAGESGRFGSEEKEHISPAIEAAREEAINAMGPLAGDMVFPVAKREGYEAVVAMYHDQGNILLKYLGRAVTVAAGLPIIRTSTMHGTAFDIAWRGIANPDNFKEAIRVAGRLAKQRKEGKAR